MSTSLIRIVQMTTAAAVGAAARLKIQQSAFHSDSTLGHLGDMASESHSSHRLWLPALGLQNVAKREAWLAAKRGAEHQDGVHVARVGGASGPVGMRWHSSNGQDKPQSLSQGSVQI